MSDRRFWYERYVHDIEGHASSNYRNGKELHEVFDQIGAEVIKIDANRYLVIDRNQVLIYSYPVRATLAKPTAKTEGPNRE
jgi:hypothetical protein